LSASLYVVKPGDAERTVQETQGPRDGTAKEAAAEASWTVWSALRARTADALWQAERLELGAYEALRAIEEHGGSLTMGALARSLAMSPSGTSRRVGNLVKDGLVERGAGEGDGREVRVSVTEAGRAVLSRAAAPYRQTVLKYFGSRITEGEAKQLLAVMRRVLETLEKPL
jgi:DNA-binding MarR family transcriptional regulator